MDSSAEGVGNDSLKSNKLSLDEKRELIHALAKQPDVATEVLQLWSRQEILQILCAEMGKERKYTGLTKAKIIEALLKIVSGKELGEQKPMADLEPQSSAAIGQRNSKRQRKTDYPPGVPDFVGNHASNDDVDSAIYCKNAACRATLRWDDKFCKRCSCCICNQYDDNKDPSLWLTCCPDPPFEGDSCGMSCHLECAFKHVKSGIEKDRLQAGLDGSFFCVSCGKENDLLGCWRKQLIIAKDTRRVDILCYRISLGHKLLKGTKKYKKLYELMDKAMKKLEADVGPLTFSPAKTARGIVNRLSSGPEVRKLCSSALEFLDKMLSDTMSPLPSTEPVQISSLTGSVSTTFEDVQATSATVIVGSGGSTRGSIVGYRLFYRKVDNEAYPVNATSTLYAPNTRFTITDLTPATDYYLKIVSFSGTEELGTSEVRFSTLSNEDEIPNGSITERSQSPATNCSSLSNPLSAEYESSNVTYCKENENTVSVNRSNDANNCMVAGGGDNIADAASPLGDEHLVDIAGLEPSSDVQKPENKKLPEGQMIEDVSTGDGSDTRVQTGSDGGLLVTPCKSDILKDSQRRTRRSKQDLENGDMKSEELENGSTSKKTSGKRQREAPIEEFLDRGVSVLSKEHFEHCVKVIRSLECEGHIEKDFRQKFLTWYSLRATPLEIRVVKVFIDTFVDDPAALSEQLVHTFSERILSNRATLVPTGVCLQLWH